MFKASSTVSLLTLLALGVVVAPALSQEPEANPRRGGRGGRGGSALNAEVIARAAQAKPDIPPGPFQPTWESIREHYKVPEWFTDAKFGIFMHWGLYAVPANGNEWYVQKMYTGATARRQVERFGPLDRFGYKDFIPLFTAAKYNPDEWVALFKSAGARYIIPTAEHHDGWALWDSALTKWDAMDGGPKRDLLGDMAIAARKAGLKFGVSNHRWEHFTFIPHPGDVKTDLTDPACDDFYWVNNRNDPARAQAFAEDWVARNVELIEKYQPDMLWFDNGVNGRQIDPVKLKVAAYYYNRAREWGKEVSLSTKSNAYLAGSILDYERGRAVEIRNEPWQEDTSMGHNSWGWTEDPPFIVRNAGEMIRELADCVSKNGNYLLNIAPKADGTISPEQQLRLLEIGSWLNQNGEAIYGTRAWTTWGEGPTITTPSGERGLVDGMLKTYTSRDIRFTKKGDTLYAIFLAYPTAADNNEFVISSLKNVQGTITSVTVLGPSQNGLRWRMEADGLRVSVPTYKPNDHAMVIKIEGLKLN